MTHSAASQTVARMACNGLLTFEPGADAARTPHAALPRGDDSPQAAALLAIAGGAG